MSNHSEIIGKIGIDKIKLCNLFGTQPFSIEEMEKAAGNVKGVISTTKTTTIPGEDFTFRFGTSANRAFCNLEISASNRREPNLLNMSVEDITTKIFRIQDYLLDEGIIRKNFSFDFIRVSSIEINRTVPLSYPFSEYDRILMLLSKSACVTEKDYIMPVIYPKAEKTGTIYICKESKTKKVKFYDKSSHLFEEFDFKTDANYLRCEITAQEQALSLIEMVNDKEDKDAKVFRLQDLTEEKLTWFYLTDIRKIFKSLDSKLSENAALTISSSPTMHLIMQSIFTTALDSNATGVCRALLEQLVNRDSFLDYKDIYAALDTSDFHESIKSALRTGFKFIETHGDITGSVQQLLGQREKYEELRDKLLGTGSYPVVTLPNFIMLPGNSQHTEIRTISGSELGLNDSTEIHIAHPKDQSQYAYAYYYDSTEKRIKYRFLTSSEKNKYLSA